jgi:CDP-4-dehydro-6-deoxyglucose reductase, E1
VVSGAIPIRNKDERLSNTNTAESIDRTRASVFEACRAVFQKEHVLRPFIAGVTYVPASAKVMDVNDMLSLVDASLDLWLTAGRYSNEFEAALPKLFNRRANALLVNSGSSANLVAASSLGSPLLAEKGIEPLKPGDEVITAAAGFPTTINPILQNNWRAVLIDVDAETLNASLDGLMAARTSKTRAVILAHTLGNPYRADLISKWCEQEGLYLIEDCCDALGATVAGDPAGSFGDYATLSFYPAHHITMGEGGAVISRSARWRRAAESMRDWGRDCWCEPGKDNTCGKRFEWQLGGLPCGYDHKYTYSSIGYNLKATDMQAAIGMSQLEKVPKFVAARRRNWRKLFEGINASPLLQKHLKPVAPVEETDPSWFGFPMHCINGTNRNKLIAFLEDHKVGTRLVFGGNMTKQPAYKNVDFLIPAPLTNTDLIMTNAFWIGVHPALDEARINYMLEQLEAGIRNQLS